MSGFGKWVTPRGGNGRDRPQRGLGNVSGEAPILGLPRWAVKRPRHACGLHKARPDNVLVRLQLIRLAHEQRGVQALAFLEGVGFLEVVPGRQLLRNGAF